MITYLRRWLIGHPLATAQAVHERLTKKVALAVFSSDALSSTAYATEEILLVLAVAAVATASRSFFFVLPISLAIAVLLWIVGISYRQTIYASGGYPLVLPRWQHRRQPQRELDHLFTQFHALFRERKYGKHPG